MKSRLLKGPTPPEVMKGDLRALLDLDQEQLEKLAAALPRFVSPDGTGVLVREEELTELEGELPVPASTAVKAVRATMYLMVGMRQTDDSVEDVADDLVEIGFVDGERRDKLVSFVHTASDSWQALADMFDRRSALEKAGVPLFRGIKTASMQMVSFEREFDVREDNLDEYAPVVRYLTPCAMVSVDIGSIGEDEHVAFLVTRDDIKRLVDFLSFTGKQLAALSGESHAVAEGTE